MTRPLHSRGPTIGYHSTTPIARAATTDFQAAHRANQSTFEGHAAPIALKGSLEQRGQIVYHSSIHPLASGQLPAGVAAASPQTLHPGIATSQMHVFARHGMKLAIHR
jgi:hypothetical protein